jgi:hypothetical protein
MQNSSSPARTKITPARRGYIVQQIIVDGWSVTQAARTLGVSERCVEAWVAEFHRSGMASLRDHSGQTLSAEMLRLALARHFRLFWLKVSGGMGRFRPFAPQVQPVPLRLSNKDGPR